MLSPELIPKEWYPVICRCSKEYNGAYIGYPKRVFSNDSYKLFTCVACERPDSLHLHRCVGCSAIFLKDFSHPGWSFDWPHCWTCLGNLSSSQLRAAEIVHKGKRQPLLEPSLISRYSHITNPGRARPGRLTFVIK